MISLFLQSPLSVTVSFLFLLFNLKKKEFLLLVCYLQEFNQNERGSTASIHCVRRFTSVVLDKDHEKITYRESIKTAEQAEVPDTTAICPRRPLSYLE
uniref:Uncharacterized protein n=1 Tax=Setaria italica TaxID=4555 RepID=K3ZKH8_SETIT